MLHDLSRRAGLRGDKAGPTLHPMPNIKLPDGDLPEQFWIYQSTWADLNSMEPALEEAFSAAGIRRRHPPLPFRPRVPLPADPPEAA